MTTAAVALAGLVAFPSAADARPFGFMQSSITFVSSRASCGCPIYKKRIFRGYDRCGEPVFVYNSVPFKCGCKKTTTIVRSHDPFIGHRGWVHRDRGSIFRHALIRAMMERRFNRDAWVAPRAAPVKAPCSKCSKCGTECKCGPGVCASGRCGTTVPHAPHRGNSQCGPSGCSPNFGDPAPGSR